MTVEVATFIADLQAVNPPSTDPRSQGDDHLRLIKQVLQNSFSGSSRQFQIPSAVAVSTSTSVTKANGESTLYVSTGGGAVTLTLPSLVAADAGWKIRICKTSSDVNPIFVAPPSGTINSGGVAGLTKARRCIPGIVTEAIWDGTNWFVTRAHALPIGSIIEFWSTTLPAGYEWPNGQTLTSGNYPEYLAVLGGLGTPDKRGRIGVCLDNLGGTDAGRLNVTGCGLQGVRTTFGGAGGSGNTTLAVANLPAFTPAGTITAFTVNVSGSIKMSNYQIVGGGSTPVCDNVGLNGSVTGPLSLSGSGSANFSGTSTSGTMLSTPFNNAPVSIMVSNILVVE